MSAPLAPQPVQFEEFFELGLQENLSPFLTPAARHWGANLTLKAAIAASFLLLLSFILSFFPTQIPLSNIFLISVYCLVGIPALIESIEDLLDLEINIDILMTLAAFSSVLIGSGMEGALLLVLFALSGSMEDLVTTKAKNAISSLHKLSPTRATVIQSDGTLIERALRDIEVGTKILIKSGQIVPLDGLVIDGISSVNLVHLTGESLPVTKKVGDQVPAGARNQEGSLTLTVTHTSSDSTLARIIQLVTQAQEARPQLQRWFEKFSRAYALTIIGLAFIFALSFPFFLSISFLGKEGSIYRSLAFLIAASPCALIIAIPISYLSALSSCAKKGILLKGGINLDALSHCKTIAFDKTGTLTTGELTCQGIETLPTSNKSKLETAIALAYALEKNAVHPIAKAILNYATERQSHSISISNFRSLPGEGLEAEAFLHDQQAEVAIGHPEFIAEKVSPSLGREILEYSQKIKDRGELVAVLLMNQEPYFFCFQDTIRPKIAETIALLKKREGIKFVMLTGDHQQNAQRIASEVGIDEFYADLKPEDKLNIVSKLAAHQGLAMVGDGINDAPALARATIGICMGKVGSTAAIDAADIVLLHDNIELLDWLLDKSYRTQAIVKQNLVLALAAICIATIPALAGVIPLWLAVVLHEGGTVLVGLNGLRLLNR